MRTKNIVIFASGNGSNAEELIKHSQLSVSSYRVRAIFTNNENAKVIDRAKKHNIPHFVLAKDYNITQLLRGLEIDLIVLAGFLKKVPDEIIEEFYTINIHPSLLPAFGGKGMYGMNVHRAVIKSGVKRTGITIHHVTSEYDKGKVLFSYDIPVLENDTEITISQKIQKLEHRHFYAVVDETCRILNELLNSTPIN